MRQNCTEAIEQDVGGGSAGLKKFQTAIVKKATEKH
jgi:hypothetical protein